MKGRQMEDGVHPLALSSLLNHSLGPVSHYLPPLASLSFSFTSPIYCLSGHLLLCCYVQVLCNPCPACWASWLSLSLSLSLNHSRELVERQRESLETQSRVRIHTISPSSSTPSSGIYSTYSQWVEPLNTGHTETVTIIQRCPL